MNCRPALFLLLLLTPAQSAAQAGLILEGIVDTEFWATDSQSRLLARNDGEPEAALNMSIWGAARFHPKVFLYALATMRSTWSFNHEASTRNGELTQLTLRYTASPALVAEAGLIESPLGTFVARRLSPWNPLIGTPDAYPVSYPWGIRVVGSWKSVDYRAGLVTLPAVNRRYVPEPSHTLRPVVGGGVTLTPSLRIGASATVGPYLGNSVEERLPAGVAWSDFDQWIIAFDARFAAGHLSTNAELTFSGYEVPLQATTQRGYAYYFEAKYTLHPRVFAAARFEQNNYPFVRAIDSTNWFATTTNFFNAEFGVGVRINRASLLKMTYRGDRWPHNPNSSVLFEDGYAVAVQFSHQFDVIGIVTGR